MRAEPRTREVVEGGEGHRFQVKAGREYVRQSVRMPAEQLAVAESGPTKGQAYLPVMPAFAKETLSDAQVDAIGDYLATLNAPNDRGPVVKLASLKPEEPYEPLKDGLQWLVGDAVRLQRGPLPGVSGRSIHVGNPNGVNYTFDPRLLAIVKIWQGGFLDMSGELTNRGNRGLASATKAARSVSAIASICSRRSTPPARRWISPSRKASSATRPRSRPGSTARKTSSR